MPLTALKARAVFPIVTPPLEDAYVVIDKGRVSEIVRRPPAGAMVEDLGNALLIPGLVNAHCHLEFSELKKPFGRSGATLPSWIRSLLTSRLTAKKVEKGVTAGLAASVAAGVTTIGEICRLPSRGYIGDRDMPRVVLMQESIGFSQARSQSALTAAKKALAELEEIVQDAPAGRLSIGVAPHAPYTASPNLVRELVTLAVDRSAPVSLHLAEAPEELELIGEAKGLFKDLLEERSMWDPWAIPRGASPLDYLRMLTRAPHALVVHGNYLDHASLAMIGRHAGAMSLVYCPRTHAYFGHQPYPLAEALSLGVRVALGTDGLASNPDLSLLTEMRESFSRHAVTPESVLRMGTLSGAEALGLDDVAGAIRAGAPADLCCLAIPAGANGGASGVLEAVLRDSQPVRKTWINGRAIETEA